MAKSKKVANPQKANLLNAVKKVVNTSTVLPILEDILFLPGKAIVTDLETVAIIPFDMPGVPKDGIAIPAKTFCQIMEMVEAPTVKVKADLSCTITEGSRSIGVLGESWENYPKNSDVSDARFVGKLNQQSMMDLETSLSFVSNDDLRPAMTGVYFCKEMVATDAHRLYHRPLGFKEDFIVAAKPLKALLALGGEYDVSYNGIHVRFLREDGVELISRAIDARFPDYKVVVPTKDHTVTLNMCPHLLGKEIKNAMKFCNKSTYKVAFKVNDNTVTISAEDVDFSFSYKNEMPATIQRHNIIITKQTKEGPVKETLPHCSEIAFNARFLLQIIDRHTGDGPVQIKLWASNKGVIINNDFLLMPLMIG